MSVFCPRPHPGLATRCKVASRWIRVFGIRPSLSPPGLAAGWLEIAVRIMMIEVVEVRPTAAARLDADNRRIVQYPLPRPRPSPRSPHRPKDRRRGSGPSGRYRDRLSVLSLSLGISLARAGMPAGRTIFMVIKGCFFSTKSSAGAPAV